MASAIGTALISTMLPPMADKAMDIIEDKGLEIVRSMPDKAMDNIKRDISRLQTTLYAIKGIVQVAEEKQIDEQGKPVIFIQKWLRNLVDIGYEARDVLDDFITFSSCVIRAEEASNPVNFISSFRLSYFGGSSSDTSNIPPLTVLNRLEKNIRSVRERFDDKNKEGETIKKEGSESVKNGRPEVGSSINKQSDCKFVEREETKKGIMEKILEPKYDRVDVVVIWGMGGIGKTTLALSIYNDESVKQVPRRWSCVGENKFSAEKVIREILNDQKSTGIANLQEKLVKELSGDRFLIVLDDVWDVDDSEWSVLFNPLTEVGKGGLIIITKREKELCPELIKIQTTYDLKPLSEEDSWSLFESCAYKDGKSDSTPDLKDIGKEIVKKLKGLPLALKVVGRSLWNKDSSTWTNFLESKLTKGDEVMSSLRWSYNHLPPHLKTCFIWHCEDLKSLPPDFHKLSSLEELSIDDCPQLQSLPPDFHKLSSLKSLSIRDCPQLQSLPPDFHKLSSLEELIIKDCPKLQSLPADGLSPSLSHLIIRSCPLLYERCKDESGLYWRKINHIRERFIRQY